MNDQSLTACFSPCIKLIKTKTTHKLCPDLVSDFSIWRQIVQEAGLHGLYVEEIHYDKILRAAGKYGYALEREE